MKSLEAKFRCRRNSLQPNMRAKDSMDLSKPLFSRDEATLYEGVSDGRSVGPMVGR